MTMLASWVGVDTHGPTSAYIISDSRISWNEHENFDHGKKVFASKSFPELFGYAGDVLFPSIVIQQILEMIDNGVLFNPDTPCHQKNEIVFNKISYELSKYPLQWSAKSFQILHITRDTIVTKERYPKFRAYTISYDCYNWERKEIEIPAESGILCIFGSGKSEFLNNYQRYQNCCNKNTSRNVFHCFVDTLNNIHDPYCGGAPQLVGIYRKPGSYAKYFGIIYNSKRYIAGSEVPCGSNYNSVDWHNENFERCDGEDKKIIDEAEHQPNLLSRS